MPKKGEQITPQQQLFVEFYTGSSGFNATDAAKRAGYAPDSAQQQGSRLLLNDVVREAVDKKLQELAQKNDVLRDRIIQEHAKIAFADTSAVVCVKTGEGLYGDEQDLLEEAFAFLGDPDDEDGGKAAKLKSKIRDALERQFVRIADTDDLPPELRHAIASIKEGKRGIEIKLHDKQKSLDSLARILGMFQETVNPGEGWDAVIKQMAEASITKGK